jgi:ATP-dependent protease Clp ATPase subunit
MTDMMFTIPSRPDISEVRITAAFIRGEEEPTYLSKPSDEQTSLLNAPIDDAVNQ